jgi:hypothetical protein
MSPQKEPTTGTFPDDIILEPEAKEQETISEEPETTNGEKKEEEKTTTYEIGDHVYTWNSYLGVPFHHQQHGIVVDFVPDSIILVLVRKKSMTTEDRDEDSDFCMVRERIALEEAQKTWFKIPYGVPWTKRLFTRAGTANPAKADPAEEALNRVGFLWKNSSLLHNLTFETTDEKDISECIVVWCKTRNFYSYHGLAKLGHHGADMGSNATLAGGVCTQVVASSVAPFMVPVFAVYDIATALQSWRATHKCKNEWRRITCEWNDKYSIAKHLRDSQKVSSIASLYSPPIS